MVLRVLWGSLSNLIEGAHGIVSGQKLLSLGLIPTIRHMFIKVPLQAQERLANHVRLVRIILDTLYENCVVKVGNLAEVAKDQVLVVAHNARRRRVVYLLYVPLHDRLQVFAKLLLGLHQLANNGPKIE